MVSLSENLIEFVRALDKKLSALQTEIEDLQRDRANAVQALERLGAEAPETVSKEAMLPIQSRETYWRMSIGDLVLAALKESFPNGANANELLDHFSSVYGRDGIKRTTLSPQLTRLKNDKKVIKNGRVWTLA